MHGERLLVDDDDLASLRVADELLILTYIQEPEFWEGDTVVAETQLMMRAEEGLTSEVIYPNPSSGTRMQMCGLPGDWGGATRGDYKPKVLKVLKQAWPIRFKSIYKGHCEGWEDKGMDWR